jgi:uncharacterized protein YjbI with pentapeptide repeats
MEFRSVGDLRIQQPNIDPDDLTTEPTAFRGEFELEFADISGGDQSGVTGEGSLSRTVVADVDLSDARLTPLSLSDVVLQGVQLSNAVLGETTARRVEITGTRAIGVQLALAQATDLYVRDSQFDYATVRIGKVKNGAAFSGCSFRETVFIGDLSSIVFENCEFYGTEFEATRAADCDLRGSRLTDVRGLLTMRGARITNEQALSVAAAIATESGLVVN